MRKIQLKYADTVTGEWEYLSEWATQQLYVTAPPATPRPVSVLINLTVSVTRLAIYWNLGHFLKPAATINLPKSPTFLGNVCKGV